MKPSAFFWPGVHPPFEDLAFDMTQLRDGDKHDCHWFVDGEPREFSFTTEQISLEDHPEFPPGSEVYWWRAFENVDGEDSQIYYGGSTYDMARIMFDIRQQLLTEAAAKGTVYVPFQVAEEMRNQDVDPTRFLPWTPDFDDEIDIHEARNDKWLVRLGRGKLLSLSIELSPVGMPGSADYKHWWWNADYLENMNHRPLYYDEHLSDLVGILTEILQENDSNVANVA